MAEFPDFYTDPNFEKSQDFLFPYGKGILEGDISDYYKPIGEYGGQEFEDILGLVQRDVTRGVTEDMARRKVRSLRGTNIISRTMGDITKKMRWDDYMKAVGGRKYLFGQGRGIVEGTRAAGLAIGGQKNVFETKRFEAEQAKETARNKMWSDIISSIIGTSGTIAGFAMNPAGAGASMASKALGSASVSGVSQQWQNPADILKGQFNLKDIFK